MIKLIDTLQGVGGFASLALFWVAIMAIKEAVEIYKWFRARLDEWYKNKHGIEEKEENIEERISRLEESKTWTREELCKQSKMIEEIMQMMKEQKKESDRITVANTRATLFMITSPALARGSFTQVEYDIFSDLAEIYEEKNGNHSMQQKIIPMAKKLPISIDL